MLNQALGPTFTRIAQDDLVYARLLFKFETFTIDGTGGFFASIGLPTITACLVTAGEILGASL